MTDLFPHLVDLGAARNLRVLGSMVAVEMFPQPEKVSDFFIPESLLERSHPHIGVVVAHGPEELKDRGQKVPFPPIGSVVLVHPEDGNGFSPIDGPGYSTANEVRVYGTYHLFPGEAQDVPWWDSILAEVQGGVLKATYDTVILKPDKAEEVTKSGLYIPEVAQVKTALATVVSVGGKAAQDGLNEGDRVLYDASLIPDQYQGYGDMLQGLVPCPWRAIQLVIG
jgi:co-chaperonin GroES (HSP10)